MTPQDRQNLKDAVTTLSRLLPRAPAPLAEDAADLLADLRLFLIAYPVDPPSDA